MTRSSAIVAQLDRRSGMRRHRADREQERVARQERSDDQPRLGEDDQEEDDVEPGPDRLRHEGVDRIGAEMDQGVEELLDEFHHDSRGLSAGTTAGRIAVVGRDDAGDFDGWPIA